MTPRLRLLKRAALWLALLGPFFYASYGLANWWAGTRSHVPSVVFDWEHHVPFLAWTIFPYWSLNLFYAASLFLGKSAHTIDRHALRLLTAQLIAVSCFFIWPLHYSFGQPAVTGAPAFLFDALRGFDKPFNQAPSLHIALVVILWDWYRQLLQSRWAQAALFIWMALICVSVLTTYQHHFIDVPTGALLGLFCVWLWPLERRVSMAMAWRTTRDARRLKLASAYALGAVLCLALALGLGGQAPAMLWLAWPAVALALVAACYLGLGARGFAVNRQGRMQWAAQWLLAPYRLGAALNAKWWTRTLSPAAEVLPGVWLGALPSQATWLAARAPHLVSLCGELQAPRPARVHGQVRCLPLLDLVTPSPLQLRHAANLIEGQHQWARASTSSAGDAIWVCCALGFSRSALSLMAWLLLSGRARNVADAEAAVRAARPQIVISPSARASLQALVASKPIAAPAHQGLVP